MRSGLTPVVAAAVLFASPWIFSGCLESGYTRKTASILLSPPTQDGTATDGPARALDNGTFSGQTLACDLNGVCRGAVRL